MNETQKLAGFIVNADYQDFPKGVIEQAKARVLDYLGATLYGSTKEWSQIVGDVVAGASCSRESTVIARSWKTAAPYAALVNGTMGHGFELDDFHARALVHPGTVVIPSALAIGERERVNGKEFLTAIVLGYEIMIRLGLAVEPSNSLRGFNPTGTNGTFGATAAAGKILNLDEVKLINALGIAGSLSSGIKEFYLEGDMVKRLHAGRAAEGGLMAALLASRGFTGPSTVLEGKYGYCRAFSDDCNFAALTETLNKRWELVNTNIKPYACCGNLHSIVEGLLDLTRQHNITPMDIERIIINTSERVALQNSGPGTKSVMSAQYSIPFTSALTLVKDIEDPAVFNESVLHDDDVLSLSKKVEVVGNINKDEIERTRVTIKLSRGGEHAIEIEKPKGHPENPLRYDELVGKFKKLSSCVLTDEQTDEVVERVASLEKLADICLLCDLV